MRSQEARDLLAWDSNWNHKPGEPIQEALAMGIEAIKNTTWREEDPEKEDMYQVAWRPSYGTPAGIPHFYGLCQWNDNEDEKGWDILGLTEKLGHRYGVENIQILAWMPMPAYYEGD